jgi:hypothetical protein
MRKGLETDMKGCPYTWASRAEKGMQLCRKGRKAADIDYVQCRMAALSAQGTLYLSDSTKNNSCEKEEII